MISLRFLRLLPVAGITVGAGLLFNIALSAKPHSQENGDSIKGEKIATQRCGACHSVSDSFASPNKKATPLRMLLRTYSADEIAEDLKAELSSGHQTAPRISLNRQDQTDLMQYLRELATGEEG